MSDSDSVISIKTKIGGNLMLSIKKIAALCAAALVLSGVVFAQGFSVSASNELGSDVWYVMDGDSEGRNDGFAGIYNEFIVDITSERIDAGLDVYAVFDTQGGVDGDSARLFYSSDDFDWYTLFRPLDVLDVAFSTDYWFRGSYMFVEDDNVGSQKLGSEGLSLVFTGLPNLAIGLTAPFNVGSVDNDFIGNFFDEFVLGVGAEYIVNDMFVIGAAVHNIAGSKDNGNFGFHDTQSVAVSAAIYPIYGLEIRAGYGFQDYQGLLNVYGTHLLNASVLWGITDRIALSGDLITNFGTGEDDDVKKGPGIPDYDLYAAIRGDFRVTDPILAYVTLSDYMTINRDAEKNDPKFCVNPGVEYDAGSIGSFAVEVMLEFVDGSLDQVYFPVKWVYEF